jgi:hypothetical protein
MIPKITLRLPRYSTFFGKSDQRVHCPGLGAKEDQRIQSAVLYRNSLWRQTDA